MKILEELELFFFKGGKGKETVGNLELWMSRASISAQSSPWMDGTVRLVSIGRADICHGEQWSEFVQIKL